MNAPLTKASSVSVAAPTTARAIGNTIRVLDCHMIGSMSIGAINRWPMMSTVK